MVGFVDAGVIIPFPRPGPSLGHFPGELTREPSSIGPGPCGRRPLPCGLIDDHVDDGRALGGAAMNRPGWVVLPILAACGYPRPPCYRPGFMRKRGPGPPGLT